MQWSSRMAVFASVKAHKPWLIGAAALVALPVSYVATSNGEGMRLVTAALADPMAVLAGRSPGARDPNALAQSKPIKKVAAAGPAAPRERVLSNVRTRPASPAGSKPVAQLAPAPVGMPELAIPFNAGSAPSNPFVPVTGIGPGGGLGLPETPGFVVGGSPGGQPGPGAVVNPEIPAPVSAVPEPTTWLMMICGFLFVGFSLRSRRRASPRLTGSLPQS